MIFATLCYIKHDRKTLMLHRVKQEKDIHKDKWNGLGGKSNPGETPEDCVIREIREESGLLIKNPLMKGFLTFPLFDGKNTWYVFVFVAKDFEGHLIDCPEGNLEWIDDERLLDLNLWEGDKIFLPLLDQPGFFSGKFTYQQGKLIDHSVTLYTDNTVLKI